MADPLDVLDALGVGARRVTTLKDHPGENANWLVDTTDGEQVVLRRYHVGATIDDLAYEHAVLRHADAAGWVVPVPLSELLSADGRWYCLNRFVPGGPVRNEDEVQRRRRGRHLAHLDLDLRVLGAQLGQRAGWCPQSLARSPVVEVDWDKDLDYFAETHGRLAAWAAAAAEDVDGALRAIGADDLPLTVVHGDVAEWNVHFEGDRLAGVLDFELTHLDSRWCRSAPPARLHPCVMRAAFHFCGSRPSRLHGRSHRGLGDAAAAVPHAPDHSAGAQEDPRDFQGHDRLTQAMERRCRPHER